MCDQGCQLTLLRHEVREIPDHLANEKFLLQLIKDGKVLQECLHLGYTDNRNVFATTLQRIGYGFKFIKPLGSHALEKRRNGDVASLATPDLVALLMQPS